MLDVGRRPLLRRSANRTRTHLWFLAISERYRTDLSSSVCQDYGESHCVPGDLTRESCRMRDTSVDRIRIDVVGSDNVKATVGARVDRGFCIAERAADVNVCGRVARDQAGIVTAPRPDDFGDWRRRCVVARECGDERRDDKFARRSARGSHAHFLHQ